MNLLFGIELREPIWLALALLAPLVYLLAQRSQGHLIFSTHLALPSEKTNWRKLFSRFPSVIFALATVAFAIAAAGPRKGDHDSEELREGIAIMMVVDTSFSMAALDLSKDDKETRLDVVKDIFEDFVLGDKDLPGRRNDAIGLIRFAGYADTASPLTLDHSSLAGVARTIELVDMNSDEDGTAIGDALALAVSRIQDSPARSKVVVLLTDGVSNRGVETPVGASELAKSAGVKVYTIGAGGKGTPLIRMPNPVTGRMQLVRADMASIDEDTLKTVAKRTDGKYFRATNKESLANIYEEIDRLERTELRQILYRQYTEYFQHALALALALVLLGLVSSATIFRRAP